MFNQFVSKRLKYLCLFSFVLIGILYPLHLIGTMPENVSASVSPSISVSVTPDQSSQLSQEPDLQADLNRHRSELLSKVNTSLIAPPKPVAKPASSAPASSQPSVGEGTDNLPKLSLAQIRAQIEQACAVRGCDTDQLYRVMMCESRGTNHISTYYKGIFQFLPSTFYANARRIGLQGANVYNPEHQIQVAAYMFSIGQARQWGCK